MKPNFVYILLLLLVMFSCKSKKDVEIRDVSDVLLTDSATTVKIIGEKLDLDLLCPVGILSLDTILLIFQDFEDKMVKVYNMQNQQFLGDFLRKGGGPDEVQMFSGFTQSFIQNDVAKVVIQSYPQYLAILDLQKTLSENETIYEKKYNFVDEQRGSLFAACNAVFYIGDDIFLLTKAPERSGRMEDGNTYFELYDYKKNEVIRRFYSTDLPFIPRAFELYKGALTLSGDRKKIVSFLRFMPVFSITDIETGSSKQFFPFRKEERIEKYIEMPGHYYWSACTTDNRIIALYKGGVEPQKLNDDELNSYLHVFDWEGRLLYKLEIEDNIKCISLNERNGMLYAVLMNDDIKKYRVKEFIGGIDKEKKSIIL